ncbi:MAG: hypothetical protein KGM42_19520 [Hyphomicrobiales bacterium]|nr:hypothetical protein [Hyphomicrobiales bacterium]
MRKFVLAVGFAFAALAAAPAQAAGGLLQDLFHRYAQQPAPQPQPQPQVVTYYAPPQQQMRFVAEPAYRARRAPVTLTQARHRIVVQTRRVETVAQRKPVVHKRYASLGRVQSDTTLAPRLKGETIGIEADATLRPGDAYMTRTGLKIYAGRAEADGSESFVDYRVSRIGRGIRSRLAAYDGRPHRAPGVPSAARLAVTAYITGASAVRRTSVDARGHTIRVVGP